MNTLGRTHEIDSELEAGGYYLQPQNGLGIYEDLQKRTCGNVLRNKASAAYFATKAIVSNAYALSSNQPLQRWLVFYI